MINSTQNEKYKYFLKLSKSKNFRIEEGSFLAFGRKIVHELSLTSSPICKVTSPEYPEEGEFVFSESLIKNLSGQSQPEGIFAQFPFPKEMPLSSPLLVLDGIQDPGNVGTLIRTTLAFNWGGLIFLPGCCDPFSVKVIQASRGAIVHIPFRFWTAEQLQDYLYQSFTPLFIADCNGVSMKQWTPSKKCALILGNEGQGVLSKVEGEPISIPIHPKCESLNVAIAGSILMQKIKSYE